VSIVASVKPAEMGLSGNVTVCSPGSKHNQGATIEIRCRISTMSDLSKMRRCSLNTVLTVFLSVTLCGASAFAKDSREPTADIPVGTHITRMNWQSYKELMPNEMQLLFAGDAYWKMPENVDMVVGPTISVPLPARYIDDTKQLSASVTLSAVPSGGYVPHGYSAGMPFPAFARSSLSMEPYEIFYNLFYHYTPRLQRNITCNYAMDSHGNVTLAEKADAVYSELAYLSDEGYPHEVSNSNGSSLVKLFEQIEPEQGKYSANLDIQHTDPTQPDDVYLYLPSNRRALRVSSAYTCAPQTGVDWTLDDGNLGAPTLPQRYKITYLGTKEIVALVHMNPEALDSCGTSTGLSSAYFPQMDRETVPWPKATLGRWELRKAYVIQMSRLPTFAAGYCYSKRVIYIDTETFFPLYAETYDVNGQPYKLMAEFVAPLRVPRTGVALSGNGALETFIVNFKDRHLTLSTGENPCCDSDCDAKYFDVERYASPGGLAKIQQ